MKIKQLNFTKLYPQNLISEAVGFDPNFVLVYGDRIQLEKDQTYVNTIKEVFPLIDIITISTAGTIHDDCIINEFSATFVELEKTKHQVKLYNYELFHDEVSLGENIVIDFNQPDLVSILLFGTTGVNAEMILKGINNTLPKNISVSGGIAGDNDRFETTFVGHNENINSGQMVAIGFYGDSLKVNHGSKGGWVKSGEEMKITKCDGNVLYEINHQPALKLYKQMLGDKVNELPASALLFPFTILNENTITPIVRTIQNIDEDNNSLILFGDVSENDTIQFMKADFDSLINGALESAKSSTNNSTTIPELAILISCVGRRIVLGDQANKEIIKAKESFGDITKICGFYSYSELSPVVSGEACLLHNQTMTITTLKEK